MLCTIQASALRRLSIISRCFYSVLSVRFACIAVGGSVQPALSSRHALSANGGLRVHQDIRQHVVEVSVHALRCATCRCKHPCDGASAAQRDSRHYVRGQRRTVMNPAKARRRHVDFSGVLRPRKSTSEKSTRSDPRHARRLKVIIKSPRRAAGIHDAQMSRHRPLNIMRGFRALKYRGCFGTMPACKFYNRFLAPTPEIDCNLRSISR